MAFLDFNQRTFSINYEEFTKERYNSTIDDTVKRRKIHRIFIVIFSLGAAGIAFYLGALFPYGTNTLKYLTLACVMGIPVTPMDLYWYFKYARPFLKIPDNVSVPKDRIIFQLTTIGRSPLTVLNSISSVHYWARKYALNYESWVITEENAEILSAKYSDRIKSLGTRIVVVPKYYTTPKGTLSKARALHYACELRKREIGLSEKVWIYHQDDETTVGEDTVLGICDFINRKEGTIGAGIIIYPLYFVNTAPHVQELTRSYDDFRTMGTLLTKRNPMVGFHGSHFLVRQDIEDSVGNDFGTRGAIAEDFLLEQAIRLRYGKQYSVLRGFAYEKSASNVRGSLSQRRRWFIGGMGVYSIGFIPFYKKVILFYMHLSWLSAILSIFSMIASVILKYGSIIEFSGVVVGLVWYGMFMMYYEGININKAYLPMLNKTQLIRNAVIGALCEAAAPWYSLFTFKKWMVWLQKDSGTPDLGESKASMLPTPGGKGR